MSPALAEAQGQNEQTRVMRHSNQSKHLRGVRFGSTAEVQKKEGRFYAFITGSVRLPSRWVLIHGKEVVAEGRTGESVAFNFSVPIQENKTKIALELVSPKGEVQREPVLLKSNISDHKLEDTSENEPEREIEKRSSSDIAPRKRVQLGWDFSFITVQESELPELTQGFFTPQVGLGYELNRTWAFYGGVSYNTIQLGVSPADDELMFLQSYGLIAYHIPLQGSPWSFDLNGGLSHSSAFSSNGDRGFQNLLSLQLYPWIERAWEDKGSLYLYGKLAPLLAGSRVLPLSNRQLEAGTGWIFDLGGERKVRLGVNFQSLTLIYQDVQFESDHFSLGVHYEFAF